MADKTLGRVLIIQTAFLGDAILTTGLIEKLYQYFPDCEIDILVRKGNESLFINHPKISEVLVFNKKKAKYFNLLRLIFKIRQKRYDMIANVQRYFTTGLITVLSNAIITLGFDKNPWSRFFTKKFKHDFNGSHEIERNHQLISWFTDYSPAKPKLYPGPEQFDNISKYVMPPYICIAPASVWFTKQYPAHQWIEVLNQVDGKVNIYLLGGGNDFEFCENIRQQSDNNNIINLCGKMTFLETAALMQKAGMNLVNDSAPMHIASAMNAPVTAIYCSTIPAFGFGPLSDDSKVIEIREDLYCRSCGIHGRNKCPEGHFRCAYDINQGEILARIRETTV